jgi:hypothetical protein
MFDINSVSDSQSAEVEIKHPVTGANVGATVTLAGPEHPKRKQIKFARQRAARKALNKTGKVLLSDPEDDEQDNLEDLAACTLGWTGFSEDGKPMEFTPAAALKLYQQEKSQWLVSQLMNALNERERFIASSATA